MILTSVVDIMTIVLVFLLVTTTGDGVQVEPARDLELPVSSSQAAMRVAVTIVATRRELIVEGVPVLAFEGGDPPTWPEGSRVQGRIPALFDALRARAGGGDVEVAGQVLLQCDRRLPYDIIRDIMYTAGLAGFADFRFVVVKGG